MTTIDGRIADERVWMADESDEEKVEHRYEMRNDRIQYGRFSFAAMVSSAYCMLSRQLIIISQRPTTRAKRK